MSHGAPRWHFPTRAALWSAVAHRGFTDLAERTAPVLADHASPPTVRLAGACRAYVAFATARTSLFELVFRHDLLQEPEPWLRHTSLPLFGALVELVREAQAARCQPERPPEVVAGALWSSVHGLAQLWLWGALPSAVADHDLDDVLSTALGAWLDQAGDDR